MRYSVSVNNYIICLQTNYKLSKRETKKINISKIQLIDGFANLQMLKIMKLSTRRYFLNFSKLYSVFWRKVLKRFKSFVFSFSYSPVKSSIVPARRANIDTFSTILFLQKAARLSLVACCSVNGPKIVLASSPFSFLLSRGALGSSQLLSRDNRA